LEMKNHFSMTILKQILIFKEGGDNVKDSYRRGNQRVQHRSQGKFARGKPHPIAEGATPASRGRRDIYRLERGITSGCYDVCHCRSL
jgi:hypothetical protein